MVPDVHPANLLKNRVLVKPIQEIGTVDKYYYDGDGDPLLDVILDSGHYFLARISEVVLQYDDGALFQQYCEVLAALETLVPGYREAITHHCGSMSDDERNAAIAVLKFCEETLEKYRVSSNESDGE